MENKVFEHVGIDLGYDDLDCETKESGRKYSTPDGVKYPSITTVLSILSRDAIMAWRRRVGAEEANKISHRASTRGTAVHAIIEKYLNNDEDYREGYLPNIIDNFLTVKEVLDSRIGKIYAQEVPLYSDYLGVAGRVDCVAEFDGKPAIIDFKTSKRLKSFEQVESYFMQEAFYAVAWEERTQIPITQLVTIISVDGGECQVFVEHRDNWVKPLQEVIARFERGKK
ncbi:PD-(D/E)XK nuclease family protein [bacterium]|nr:PD-(D/E)XK nuclease family protein [bacterium]